MKVLVTGGSGFIGSAVCRHLHSYSNVKIVNVDLHTYAASGTALAALEGSSRYAFVKADVADAAAMDRVFHDHRPDTVMHLAAESHVDRSIDGPGEFVRTNVVGSFTMLNSALSYWRGLSADSAAAFRFLQVSTDEVFGSLGTEGLFTERTAYDPRSPYSASKAAADHMARAWFHTYGLPVLVSNCSNNYGPYHFPEKLIPLTIIRALEGQLLSVYGDGGQVRDWLYVDDHAQALHLIATRGRPGETYNVGGGNERTNLETVEAICDLLDELRPTPALARRSLIHFVADRPGHDRRYAIDASKLQDQLGWRASHDWRSGLRLTVQWFLDHEEWWRPLEARYDGGRIGLAGAGPEVETIPA
jgi:dTDP-glucose 4,6-dehydratase